MSQSYSSSSKIESISSDDREFDERKCPRIEKNKLKIIELFDNEEKFPDYELLKNFFLNQGRLEKDCALLILERVQSVLKTEPNLLQIESPLNVCGDIHGQFYDLTNLFELGGDPKESQYLFLGDYVDRGCFSCECIFLLFAMKINFPKNIHLLRGNHESRSMTTYFNFRDEVLYKYNFDVYDKCMKVFDALPLAAVIDDKYFCLHGGLSPSIKKLSEINLIDRFCEVPKTGGFCDLLWADPCGETSSEITEYSNNHKRRCSYIFGQTAVDNFLKQNNLVSVLRAHEAQKLGYKFNMIDSDNFPKVVTVFSAPNYCDIYGNKGSFLKISQALFNVRQFSASKHPYYLPNFMDVFSWSLPFMAEKVTSIFKKTILAEEEEEEENSNQKGDKNENNKNFENLNENDENSIKTNEKSEKNNKNEVELIEREKIFKRKINAVSTFLTAYKTLKKENDLVLKLKQLSPNSKIPQGTLLKGKKGLEKAISTFEEAEAADIKNEQMPLE